MISLSFSSHSFTFTFRAPSNEKNEISYELAFQLLQSDLFIENRPKPKSWYKSLLDQSRMQSE